MATDKINISSLPETNVDWYADGERANAENLNRPIKDVSVIVNNIIDNIISLEAVVGTPAEELATLGANTWEDTQNFADNLLTRATFLDVSEKVNILGDLGGGTDAINLELGNVITATVTTTAQAFTFTNPPASGSNGSFVLFLTNGGSQSVTWPTSVDWPGGTAPTLTASGLDILVFTTNNGGSSWTGLVAGLAVA